MSKACFAVGAISNVYFETACRACILSENVVYLSRVLRVESLLDLLRVLEVASAAAELNVHLVVGRSWTVVVNYSFFASKYSHLIYKL